MSALDAVRAFSKHHAQRCGASPSQEG